MIEPRQDFVLRLDNKLASGDAAANQTTSIASRTVYTKRMSIIRIHVNSFWLDNDVVCILMF